MERTIENLAGAANDWLEAQRSVTQAQDRIAQLEAEIGGEEVEDLEKFIEANKGVAGQLYNTLQAERELKEIREAQVEATRETRREELERLKNELPQLIEAEKIARVEAEKLKEAEEELAGIRAAQREALRQSREEELVYLTERFPN